MSGTEPSHTMYQESNRKRDLVIRKGEYVSISNYLLIFSFQYTGFDNRVAFSSRFRLCPLSCLLLYCFFRHIIIQNVLFCYIYSTLNNVLYCFVVCASMILLLYSLQVQPPWNERHRWRSKPVTRMDKENGKLGNQRCKEINCSRRTL